MSALLQKTGTILTIFMFIGLSLFAQAPEKMSYQAVIRKTNGDLVISKNVGIKISILQGTSTGTAVYTETHTPTTNANGLVSLAIGRGITQTGSFSTINWGSGPYFIKTETDTNGGTTYMITGTTELLSVPYALYAKSSGNGIGDYAYIYNTTSQTVAIGASVVFSNNGVTKGITHIQGSSNIIIGTAGTYEISFHLSAIEPNQFALYQNGVIVEGTLYGSAAGTQQNTGMSIITASAGDVLTLTNHSSPSATTLQPFAGGTQTNVNASIKILNLGN